MPLAGFNIRNEMDPFLKYKVSEVMSVNPTRKESDHQKLLLVDNEE